MTKRKRLHKEKPMAIFKQLLMSSLLMVTTCNAASWYSKDPEGWLWYKKIPKKTVLKSKPEKTVSPSEANKPLSYREQMKKVRQNFDEVQAKAILNPTIENVTEFQRAQNTVLNQADIFQKMLMMAAMMEGQNTPTSMMATPVSREIYQGQEAQQLEKDIRALSKNYGLFFIVKNDCPYCHQFAPIIKEFVEEYKFDIKVIAKDGLPPGTVPMKEFPEAVPDNGTIKLLNPEGIYPCLLLVNPQTREVIPLAKGLINKTQLKDNFRVIIQFLKRQHQGRNRS